MRILMEWKVKSYTYLESHVWKKKLEKCAIRRRMAKVAPLRSVAIARTSPFSDRIITYEKLRCTIIVRDDWTLMKILNKCRNQYLRSKKVILSVY